MPFDGDEGAGARARTRWRRVGIAAVAAVCAALVAVPVALVLGSGRSRGGSHDKSVRIRAEDRVISALSATVSSGSFDFAYSLGETPGRAPHSATACYEAKSGVGTQTICSSSGPHNVTVTGAGTINANPFSMVASAHVSNLGDVSVRVDGTRVWEYGGGDYGLAPRSTSTGPGAPISGFASLVEGTLGPREGAISMISLASPTGYLVLTRRAVETADRIGTGTVDGAAVTFYRVSIDLSKLTAVEGITSEEVTTIGDALPVLEREGYQGTTVNVAIDDKGFIREAKLVAGFSDGGAVTIDTTFSNFGCAGTVLMPGEQAGPTTTSPLCDSSETSTSATSASEPATSASPSPTTIAPSTTTATTTPPSTTSTEPPASTTPTSG